MNAILVSICCLGGIANANDNVLVGADIGYGEYLSGECVTCHHSQELIKISVGDSVTWVATDRGHNVEMVASPNNMELKSKLGKDVTVSFDAPGIYYYWCTPHKGMGMIGLVVVGDDTSNMDQIIEAKAMGESKKKLKDLLGQL